MLPCIYIFILIINLAGQSQIRATQSIVHGVRTVPSHVPLIPALTKITLPTPNTSQASEVEQKLLSSAQSLLPSPQFLLPPNTTFTQRTTQPLIQNAEKNYQEYKKTFYRKFLPGLGIGLGIYSIDKVLQDIKEQNRIKKEEERLNSLAELFATNIQACEKSPKPTKLDAEMAKREFTQSEAHMYFMAHHAKDLPGFQYYMQEVIPGLSNTFRDTIQNPPTVTTLQDVRSKEDQLLDFMTNITIWPGYFGLLRDFKPMMKEVLAKEREFASNYVFYHGHKAELGLLFDVYREIDNFLLHAAQIFKNKKPECSVHTNIRLQDINSTPSIFPFQNMNDFMKRNNVWNDHKESLRQLVRSVNFSLFANTSPHGYKENSLYFFATTFNVFNSHSLDTLFSGWKFNENYKDQLNKLYYSHFKRRDVGHLLQIFIPADKVDAYVYTSNPYGKPIQPKIVTTDANEDTHSPNLPQKLDSKSFLSVYRTKPEVVENIDNLQGRIVLFPSFFDPDNGVKIFRYTAAGLENNEDYKKELRNIVGKMMVSYVLDHQKEIESGSDKVMKNILESILHA